MTRVECLDCDAGGWLDDHNTAHELAEGHADRHNHRVEVGGEEVEA